MTTTDHTDTPVKIPAKDLRKGDRITMGTIAQVTPRDTYVSIKFESANAFHGTAFSFDLEVTVFSRGPVEVDVVAELTALADTFDWDKSHRSLSQEDCAEMLRELLARLA